MLLSSSAEKGISNIFEGIRVTGAFRFIWFIEVDDVVDEKSIFLVNPLSNIRIFHKVGRVKIWSDGLFDDQVGPSGIDDVDILQA